MTSGSAPFAVKVIDCVLLTVTVVDAGAAEVGVKSGEMVQVVPTGIGLVHPLDTLNCAFPTVPRKGEDRMACALPELVTVNTPVQATPLP